MMRFFALLGFLAACQPLDVEPTPGPATGFTAHETAWIPGFAQLEFLSDLCAGNESFAKRLPPEVVTYVAGGANALLTTPSCRGEASTLVEYEGAHPGFWRYDANGNLAERLWIGGPDGQAAYAKVQTEGKHWTEIDLFSGGSARYRFTQTVGDTSREFAWYEHGADEPFHIRSIKQAEGGLTIRDSNAEGESVSRVVFAAGRPRTLTIPDDDVYVPATGPFPRRAGTYTYTWADERLARVRLEGPHGVRNWTFAYEADGQVDLVTIEDTRGGVSADFDYQDGVPSVSRIQNDWMRVVEPARVHSEEGAVVGVSVGDATTSLKVSGGRDKNAFTEERWAATGVLSPTSANVAKRLCEILEERHLQKTSRKTLGRRTLALFLAYLDPDKSYFLASDLVAFEKEQDEIADAICQGDLSFASEVVKSFYTRFRSHQETLISEIDGFEKQLRLGGINAVVNEVHTMVLDGQRVSRPKSKKDAVGRLKADFVYAFGNAVIGQQDVSQFFAEYKRALRNRLYEFAYRSWDSHRTGYLNAFVQAHDANSNWQPKDKHDAFRALLWTTDVAGVGIVPMIDDRGHLRVGGVQPESPAAGKLSPGDRILAIASARGAVRYDEKGARPHPREAAAALAGRRTTLVRVTVQRGEEEVEVALRRRPVKTEDERVSHVVRQWRQDGRTVRVGVIRVPSFYRGTHRVSDDVATALNQLKKQGVTSIVLDLSDNGGGVATEAAELLALFVPDAITYFRGRTDDDSYELRATSDVVWEGGLVVLTGDRSASGSELVAGGIWAHRRGLVVGDSCTVGKGTQQVGIPLCDVSDALGSVFCTNACFYAEDGQSPQFGGLRMDIVLPRVQDSGRTHMSTLPYAVGARKIEVDPVEKGTWLSSADVRAIQEASKKRTDAKREFGGVFARRALFRRATSPAEKAFALRDLFQQANTVGRLPYWPRTSGYFAMAHPYYREVVDIAVDVADRTRASAQVEPAN